ncbi:unnamed protein product [Tuber aestivum]|uniref:Nephrocystin 3-like N-terminal domain-containing protein n=1 Tax=Tuber aestivum TaxID=59557 RepID=A0A292Q3H9_9PEZI|nr:unnamed protein product [Tuber aestivum]
MTNQLFRKTVTKVLRKLNEKELREAQRWLNIVDPASNYSSPLAVREPGTGGWLLEGPESMDWKEDRGGVPWLHGISGCGKSVLGATAIEDVQHLCNANDDYALAYFHSTFSDSEKQELHNMLLSLISQLPKMPSDRGLPGGVVDLYNSTKAIGMPAGITAPEDLLSHIVNCFRKSFVVLDALDEFPKNTRESLLSWIGELTADHKVGSLSVLVTSRPEADMVRSLGLLAAFPIPLQSKIVDQDIRTYVQKSLGGKDGFKKFTKEIKN